MELQELRSRSKSTTTSLKRPSIRKKRRIHWEKHKSTDSEGSQKNLNKRPNKIPQQFKKYKFQNSSEQGQSFEFSTIPRFEDNFFRDRAWSRISKSKTLKNKSNFVKQNIKLQTNFASEFSKKRQQRNFQKEKRLFLTKTTRDFIIKYRKENNNFKLNEKFRKVEMRKRKYEIATIKASWIVLSAILGVVFSSSYRLQQRKHLKFRSSQLLSWCMQVTKSIGRFKIILKSIQQKNALKKIKQKLIPKSQIWLKKRKLHLSQIITDRIQRILSKNLIIELKISYYKNVNFLSKKLKNLLRTRRIHYSQLLTKWNLLLFTNKRSTRITQSTRPSQNFSIIPRNRAKASFVIPLHHTAPDNIKIFYLRNHLKSAFKNFSKTFSNYKHQLNRISRLSKFQLHSQDLIDYKGKTIYPTKPSAPQINQIFTQSAIYHIIQTCNKDRKQWTNRIKEDIIIVHNSKFHRQQSGVMINLSKR